MNRWIRDETRAGRSGIWFVDNPNLVNVAVSRAEERFILVTDHEMLPKSRNLRDLIGYISYHDPAHPVGESRLVSVFDLLYRQYSDRLMAFARRLRGEMRYRSEDIVWTLLTGILTEPKYAGLSVVAQVLLQDVLVDLTRLTDEQAAYVTHRASFDFLVFNAVTRRPALAVEVDGWAFHENKPDQLRRDNLKDAICREYRLPLLRLATTGSSEEARIRRALDSVIEMLQE